MENFSPADDPLWAEQQRAHRAQTAKDHREWLKSVALVFALIVLTLAAAATLAGWINGGSIRL
jgi:hypothetical protein